MAVDSDTRPQQRKNEKKADVPCPDKLEAQNGLYGKLVSDKNDISTLRQRC